MYEAPMATAGGISLLVTAAVVGDLIADAIDRYVAGYDPAASPAPTLPAPYTVDNAIPKWNNDSAAMAPGVARIGWQFLFGLLAFGSGALIGSPALKFLFYGLGTGAAIHLGSQIVTAYIITPMVKGSTSTGARMYQHEINVYNSLANPTGGILGAQPAGRQLAQGQPAMRVGAPPQLPQNQPAARVPVALASVATPVGSQASQASQDAQPRVTMGAPPSGNGHQAGCGCAACRPSTAQPAAGGTHPLWSLLLDRTAA